MAEKQTAGRDQLGDFAPKFAELNDDVLFGQVWSREELSAHQRSIITISSLISGGNFEQLPAHLKIGKQNGITGEEIAEIITHLAFYVGWPKAWSAFNLAKNLSRRKQRKQERGVNDDKIRRNTQWRDFSSRGKNEAYAQVFTGQSYLNMLVNDPEVSVGVGNVTFEPGCRNHWHVHTDGYQILLVTGGEGWYQEEGKPARRLRAGDVVVTHKGIKHWHGATKDSWFEHLAITSGNSEFLEAVTDEVYEGLENQ